MVDDYKRGKCHGVNKLIKSIEQVVEFDPLAQFLGDSFQFLTDSRHILLSPLSPCPHILSLPILLDEVIGVEIMIIELAC